MSRKNVILIAVIVVMVGGSVFVLYRGLYAKPAPQATGSATAAANALSPHPAPSDPSPVVATPGVLGTPGAPGTAVVTTLDQSKILPLGTKLDLTLIKKYNADGRLYNYPKVDSSDVGAALNDLIKKSP